MVGVAFRSREVKGILTILDSFGGTDTLGLSTLLLKELALELAPKASNLFRLLFHSARFSLSWRTVNITLIPKGASSSNACNCHPISITPIL